MNQTRKNTSPSRKSSKKNSTKAIKFTRLSFLKFLRLVEHKHTGKVLHHRHTSHFALLLILTFLGLFMYIAQDVTSAYIQDQSGNISVGLVVPGPPPALGASIVAPSGESLLGSEYVDITGTCQPRAFVVVYNNGQSSGNAICSTAGQFIVNIRLVRGSNDITALNYDDLNQPGPATPVVTIYFAEKVQSVESIPVVILPTVPVLLAGAPSGVDFCDGSTSMKNQNISKSSVVAICSKITTPTTCDDYINNNELPLGGNLSISVVCTPRYISKNNTVVMGVLVWGGEPPYALNVKWGGSEKDTLVSIPKAGYTVVRGVYSQAGSYDVALTASDKVRSVAHAGTTIEVNGDTNKVTSFAEYIDKGIHSSWFETPVPLYMMALVVTLGFWGGDIFDRYLGASKARPNKIRHV